MVHDDGVGHEQILKAEWTRPYSVELPPNNRDAILAKRPYRRTRYFGRNELSGLVMGALRLATRPLTSAENSHRCPTGEGNADRRYGVQGNSRSRVLTVLRRLAKRGTVAKSGPKS
jgi:hypothetical protein